MASNSFSALSGNLPASVSLVAFTMIMKRISVSSGFQVAAITSNVSWSDRQRGRLFLGRAFQVREADLEIRANQPVEVDEEPHDFADEERRPIHGPVDFGPVTLGRHG